MVRLALGLLLLVSVTACSQGEADPKQAQTMKTDVDAAVRELVPELAQALGATVAVGNSAGFLECSMTGSWDYAADGAFYGPRPSEPEARQIITDLLEQRGFTTDMPVEDTVRGKRGAAIVVVNTSLTESAGEQFRRYSFGSGCTALSGDAADYARGKHRTDFSDLQTQPE